jgi:hypothetical protein
MWSASPQSGDELNTDHDQDRMQCRYYSLHKSMGVNLESQPLVFDEKSFSSLQSNVDEMTSVEERNPIVLELP